MNYYMVMVTDWSAASNGANTRSVVGEYRNMPNAVFGSMRRLKLDAANPTFLQIRCELLPPCPRRSSKAAYMRALRASHESL